MRWVFMIEISIQKVDQNKLLTLNLNLETLPSFVKKHI